MKKVIFILVQLNFFAGAFAQETLSPVIPAYDSIVAAPEHQYMEEKLYSDANLPIELPQTLNLPVFNLRQELIVRRNYGINHVSFDPHNYWINNSYFSVFHSSPVFFSGQILSKGAFQIGNNLTIGGFSYGLNPSFLAPIPKTGINNYDLRGSTLFLKYKISDNFKIETRFNVIKGYGY